MRAILSMPCTSINLILSAAHRPRSRMTPVVMIAGDGIGPEVMAATQEVLRADATVFG